MIFRCCAGKAAYSFVRVERGVGCLAVGSVVRAARFIECPFDLIIISDIAE